MEHDLKKVIGFSILDFLYWAYFGAFLGFVTTYFLSCGMSSSMLSLVMAAYMFMAFLGAFFWGGMSDKKQSNKKVFIPELIALTVLCMAEFFLVKINIFFAAVMHPLVGFMAAPLGTNLDSWMLRSFHRDAAQFGRARALGSAGYAVMMLIGGQVYNKIGFSLIPVVTLALFTIIMVLACLMQEEPYEQMTAKREKVNTKDLLKIRPYVFLVVTIFLTGIAIAPINSLKIVIIESVGGDVSILGLDSFIGVMVQAVFIFISGNLKRIPAKIRMLIMACMSASMLVLTWLAVSPYMIIIGTVMNNIAYGVLLPTMRETTEKNVPAALKNTAHSLTDAMFGSFAGVIALLYSGTLMDLFGAKFIAFLGMLIMIIPIGLCIINLLKKED